MMRFDRFTERAQDAAQRAAEIIQRYGHNQIDTEHILLALIEQPQGVITQILEKLNIEIEALTDRIDHQLRASPKANIYGGGAGQIFSGDAQPAWVRNPLPIKDQQVGRRVQALQCIQNHRPLAESQQARHVGKGHRPGGDDVVHRGQPAQVQHHHGSAGHG